MILFKCCRRCGGDLSLEKDEYGPYMSCIQCGSHTEVGMVLQTTSRQPAPDFAQEALSVLLGVPLALQSSGREEPVPTSGKAA
ncbi:MAG: hypothetical protein HY672_01780 [Chloroflexi bacterium]|nr:hypothetical protein [Chloroflexota bacterium]